MTEKGVNHISETGEVVGEKVDQVGEFKVTANDEIADSFDKDKMLECPYPNHNGYTKVWKTLSPEQQKEMKENIRITEDGKVEIIKMKKKFSVLSAQPNGIDIVDGSHKDSHGGTGLSGVIYFNAESAERESNKQGKKLLENEEQVSSFMSTFPGKKGPNKILNFVQLFDLECAGYYIKECDLFQSVGPTECGCVTLSKEYASRIYQAEWTERKNPSLNMVYYTGIIKHEYSTNLCQQVISYEDC